MAEIIFQTDQTGANQNICSTAVASTVTFNFALSANYTAYAASITIKKASATVDPVVATIYSQPNGGGSVVSSSSVAASAVTQSFAPIEFLFTNAALTAGNSYSLVLSSTSSCSGSTPYSFKSGNFQIVDRITSAVINTGYAIISSMSANTTLTAAPKASIVTSSSLSSSSTLLAEAFKSKAMNLSSYVVSLLSSAANVIRAATLSIQSESSYNLSAQLEANSSCEIKNNTSLSLEANAEFSTSSTIESLAKLESDALVDRNLSCTKEMVCSILAAMNTDLAANATLECSSQLEGDLLRADNLFSVSSSIGASTELVANMSVDHSVHFNGDGNSSVVSLAALLADAMSGIESTTSIYADIDVFGEMLKKKREGSGHYVLNKGAFILRQWKRFHRASENRGSQQTRNLNNKNIDLRSPFMIKQKLLKDKK